LLVTSLYLDIPKDSKILPTHAYFCDYFNIINLKYSVFVSDDFINSYFLPV